MQRHVCRDAARGRVREFQVTASPCVAPQVSLVPFIGKYAIHSFYNGHRDAPAARYREKLRIEVAEVFFHRN